MKRKTKARIKRERLQKEMEDVPRRYRRGKIGKMDLVPVYRRDMEAWAIEKFGSQAVYFDDWCIAQIGMSWTKLRDMMVESDCDLLELDDYGKRLAQDFRAWAYHRGYQPRGTKLW